tara:strand:+ start:1656 stop:1769 length:114 start_codon:yes stop_codon:yes gene_type:complete
MAAMTMRMATHHKEVRNKEYHQEQSESQVGGYPEKGQ